MIKRACDVVEEPPVKRARTDADQEKAGDEGILWRVNVERFLFYFRDQAIVSAVQNRLDQVGFP